MVFLENTNDKSDKSSKLKEKTIASYLAEAEAQVLKAQSILHEAQKQYAKAVGKWPNNLSAPFVPDNKDLPQSVAQAIEQGLDNYLFILSSQDKPSASEYANNGLEVFHEKQKHKAHQINRSVLEFSNAIRASWDEWTEAGIRTNTLKKELTEMGLNRDNQLSSYKKDKGSVKNLLEAQKALYKKQIAYNKSELRELSARYLILDSIGTMQNFINVSTNAAESENNVENSVNTTSPEIADLDKIDLPYPDYKPQFNTSLADTMAMNTAMNTELNSSTLPAAEATPNKTEANSSNSASPIALKPCYVSAGTFKNKANAVALVNRLQGLGFMAFLKTDQRGSSVLIGPYDYPRHANVGMQRLKDIAHVQGVLVFNAGVGIG
jgi:adhesin transport system outer membrane protein